MAWKKKPKLTKLSQFVDLLEKAVDVEVQSLTDKIDRIKSVLEGKRKADELAAKSNRTTAG